MTSDMEGITGSLWFLCLISLTTANSAPTIGGSVYKVCEDLPIGQEAFIIAATDPEGDSLTFTLTGVNSAFFNVENPTGNVTVKRKLDRESSDFLEVDVTVSDGLNTVYGTLTVILNDANDNKPIFEEASYDEPFSENTSVGTSLFTVRASDADTGNAGIISYNIEQVTPSAGFSLFTIGNTNGVVTLNGKLDYNKLGNSYRLKINATDGGGKCFFPDTVYQSTVVYAVVSVVDQPDLDPVFTNLPYSAKVEENSPLGQSVFQVNAFDQDTGINDKITYSIESSSKDGLFAMNSESGVISVASAIDRERDGDTVSLTVKATESKLNTNGNQASNTTTVEITIIDVNDNMPEFVKCEGEGENPCVEESNFIGEVLEHSLGLITIGMTVRDQDKVSRTKLTLEGTYKDVFSVEPQNILSSSAVQLLVKKPEILDYESITQMIIQVIAEDQDDTSLRSTATVTINIKDANDNSPYFPSNTYKLDVAEHSTDMTEVAVITAVDPDTMDEDKLTYTLLPESILPIFDVEPQSGKIYVKNGELLDREARSQFLVTLQAKDTDGKPGTTVLEITVTDINDQKPVFNRDSYQFFVKEGAAFEETIQATDADDPNSENSQIVYGIAPGKYSNNFTINSETGVLTNTGELDREALSPELNGKIELSVTATDHGDPPQSSSVPVIVNVEDVNDNTPQFEASSYSFSVKEAEKGAFVGTVKAKDLDQSSEFNRISFAIEGSFGLFTIRTILENGVFQGRITVDQDIELDYEGGHKEFTLQVDAADLEGKATVKVDVKVIDVNDERPEFLPLNPMTVKENTTITGVVGTFEGFDKDGNHDLEYKMESVQCRCKGTMKDCDWFILSPSGEVSVNPDVTVDYEECDQAVIEAWVIDKNTEKGQDISEKTGEMVINIQDVNDNAPEFIPSDAVFVVVSEGASKGTSVARVTATDEDTGVYAQVHFAVTGVKFVDTSDQTTNMRLLFEAVTTQQNDIYVGIIQTTEKLEMSLRGKYLVTVSATDPDMLSRSTVLEIFTVDDAYKIQLQFTKTVDEVEKNRDLISRTLQSATKAAVEIVSIRSQTKASRNTEAITIMDVYFVYGNGTALSTSEVEKLLSNTEYYIPLVNLGLTNIGAPPVADKSVDTVKFVLLGIVAGLVVVLIVLTTSMLCSRTSYKRKLKAAKAMNTTSMMGSDNQKGGAVVPGTNKYTMEGANPVLNLNIDTAMVLDEESSDADKVSLNSLDYSDDTNGSESDRNRMKIIREEDEDEEDDGPPQYIEPLGAALAQRGQRRDSSPVGFDNPAFSTTDL